MADIGFLNIVEGAFVWGGWGIRKKVIHSYLKY